MTRAIEKPDRDRISHWHQRLDTVPMLCVETDDSPEGRSLTAFAEDLVRLVPGMALDISETDNDDDLPALVITDRVRFHGVPSGPELDAFLASLTAAKTPSPLAARVRHRLVSMEVPARLQLFVAPNCPHCPGMMRQLVPIWLEGPAVSVDIVDVAAHPATASEQGIQSVPTLILDDALRWTGRVDTDELVDAMVDRDPVLLGPDTLRQIIESGRAADLAEMMVATGSIFPALAALLAHEKWSVRLGAMVTAEEIHARSASLSKSLAGMVLSQMDAAAEPVKGDLLYLLGEIGTASLVPDLRRIAETAESDDIREAAEEAISAISPTL